MVNKGLFPGGGWNRFLVCAVLVSVCLTPWRAVDVGPAQIAGPGICADAAGYADVIVQGAPGADLEALVRAHGGQVRRSLHVIDAVAARVTADRVGALARAPGVRRVWQDANVRALSPSGPGAGDAPGAVRRGRERPETFEALNAMPVWAAGNRGAGVGLAVLDSGVKAYRELTRDPMEDGKGLGRGYDALAAARIDEDDDGEDSRAKMSDRGDPNGHGTMVASVISNAQRGRGRKYLGVAPDSTIIPVRVLDRNGQGSYSQVIDGIQWVIEHRHRYNIRIMNVSLSAPVRSWYWDDPLNQAVMRAWEAGIVVVVAAGNGGPDPMTIGVPGNVPYVITVGALTDAHTPCDWSDDTIPAYSAAGPTYEAFVKPDLVAPGGHVVGLMPPTSRLAREHPESRVTRNYYTMSGTSMSAAQVSGLVALMLAEDDGLSPDEVKYRLMASARPALVPQGGSDHGGPAYSVWQQGAGRVDAYGAVYGGHRGRANQGLDVSADLALAGAPEHYVGYTRWDEEGERFTLKGAEDHVWGGNTADIKGFVWSEASTGRAGFVWSEAYAWGGGFVWSETYTWGEGFAWSEGFVWPETLERQGYPWSEAVADLVIWVPSE
jgi:serine protease AprX